MKRAIFITLLFYNLIYGSVSKSILKDTPDELVIKLVINARTDADLFPTKITIGLPNSDTPQTDIQFEQKTKIPFKTKILTSNKSYSWSQQQRIQNLETAILTIHPLKNESEYFQQITIRIKFNNTRKLYRQSNRTEKLLLENRVVNWFTAKQWVNKDPIKINKVSEFPAGKWLSFQLFNDEVTCIKAEQLYTIIPDIDEMDPRSFQIFMSAELGRSRTHEPNQLIQDNLVEVAIKIIGEDDGILDLDDKIIFYGRGASGYDINGTEIKWHQNLYFNSNKTWLLIPDNPLVRGKRVIDDQPPNTIDIALDYVNTSMHFETDLVNPNTSGTLWVGDAINAGGSQAIIAPLSFPKTGVDIKIKATFKGHSLSETDIATHSISVHHMNVNGNQIGNTIIWSGAGIRSISQTSADITPLNGTNYFHLVNSSNDQNSAPYLDYFELDYGRELILGETFQFTSPVLGQNVRFVFSGTFSINYALWDISNPAIPKNITILQNGYVEWSSSSISLGRFELFDLKDLPEVTDLVLKSNFQLNNLRNTINKADYVIIGPEEFKTATQPLQKLRAPAIYASLESIYDEFSGGNPDPISIKTFIQWTQEQWQSPSPFAALLLGDAGYDYRNITGYSTIIVPTIQVSGTRSYASDDRLATLYGNLPEIALGRFPAKNIDEVEDFVEKINALETNSIFGPWRQKVTLIADDAARPEPNHGSISTGKSHTLNSEELALMIPPSIYIDKLYMMEFPEVSDASAYGVIKPNATEKLFEKLNTGTAIISYIGHGSPYQLAQEKLLYLDRGDINSINTGLKLPLWIVGTCSFGHFDDPLTESFAEELIRQPMNAASMIIATTRAITVTGNERYTKDLFETIFRNNAISTSPVGVILQTIKDGTSESEYFHLFGDPAMNLPMPKVSTSITSINPDTLRTLGTASFFGQQEITAGSGYGFVSVLDADRNVNRDYTINSEPETLSYSMPGATLFRGKFTFQGMEFSGQLRIPQDISYNTDPARLLVYIHDNNHDAMGVIENIPLVGGESVLDKNGPIISFETPTGLVLRSGDHLSTNEALFIRFSDPIGINVTNEIGHEIQITDLKNDLTEIITERFYYDDNSITTGIIELNSLNDNENLHILVKAWDNANNPSEIEIELSRIYDSKLKIYNAYNYPNPFTHMTQFAFEITANAEVWLDIYTIGGRRIKSFEPISLQPGYHYIDWDGYDAFQGELSNGVYLYRLKAVGIKKTETYIGRCAKFK